jgi:hypothetical protein
LDNARAITLKLLSRIHPSRTGNSVDNSSALEYEFSCWVDGVTTETLDEFCSILQDSSGLSFQSVIVFAKAWQEANMKNSVPPLPVSPILVQALQNLPRASKNFARLTCQVAVKCLLYQTNPLPLAVLIQDACQRVLNVESSAIERSSVQQLAQYSRTLVHYDESSESEEKAELLVSVLNSSLSGGSYRELLAFRTGTRSGERRQATPSKTSFSDAVVLVRQLAHLVTVSRENELSSKYVNMLRKLVPVALVVSSSKCISPSFCRVILT